MAGKHGTRMLWLYARMVTALLLTAFTRGAFRGQEFDETIPNLTQPELQQRISGRPILEK